MSEILHESLRDGTRVLLRPIGPHDRQRLVEGLRRLSERSRRLRFHAAVQELSDDQLRYLTEVDQVDHVAWVALDRDRPDDPGVGVARYVRVTDEPTVAEAAITVADAYQGRGAGTLLLGTLAGLARRHGIGVFRNYVLADNDAMLDLFERLGGTRELDAPGVYRVDLELPQADEDLPDSPAGRAFRAAARRELAIDRTIPPLWLGPADPAADDEISEWLRRRARR